PHWIRRALWLLRWILLQLIHNDLNRFLQLRVMSIDDIGGHLLDFDVRSDADVLDYPSFLRSPYRKVGRGHPSSIHQHRKAENADQSAPGALADKLAQTKLAPHPWQIVAARAGRLINNHHLWTLYRRGRVFDIRAVAHRPVRRQWPAKNVDVVVRRLPTAVEPLIYDDRFLVGLWVKIPFEVGVALVSGVRNIDIRNA